METAKRNYNVSVFTQREMDRVNREKVIAATIEDGHGNRIRGIVDRVRCGCGVMRFDDGTACRSCGRFTLRATIIGNPEAARDEENVG